MRYRFALSEVALLCWKFIGVAGLNGVEVLLTSLRCPCPQSKAPCSIVSLATLRYFVRTLVWEAYGQILLYRFQLGGVNLIRCRGVRLVGFVVIRTLGS